MAAAIEKAIANGVAARAATAEWADAAAERVAKIERGEDVQGGLRKPMTREDIIAWLLKAGWTRKDLRRAGLDASLGQEFEPALKAALGDSKLWEALDDHADRLMRRRSGSTRRGEIDRQAGAPPSPSRCAFRAGSASTTLMAEIVARRLVQHLNRAGFVVMKRPP